MSWLFSQALVEEYSEENSSDGEPSAPLNVMPTPHPFWRNDKTIDFSTHSLFGPMSQPLTASRGEALLMSFRAAFPARTSPPPEKEPESKAPAPGSGPKWRGLYLKCNPATHSLRTVHSLWEEDLPWSSVTLPKWGMMRDGELWERIMPPRLISGTDVGLSVGPPTASMAVRSPEFSKGRTPNPAEIAMWPTPTSMERATVGKGELFKTKTGTVRRRNTDGSSSNMVLSHTVRARVWPTPTTAEATKIPAQANYGQKGLNNHPAIRGEPTRPKLKKDRAGFDGGTSTPRIYATPKASPSGPDYARINREKSGADDLATQVAKADNSGQLNPSWVEWLMGWPIGWTDLKPLETDKFQRWLRLHGEP